MKITAEGYRAMLDSDDLSSVVREEFEYRRKQAEKREAAVAKITEQRRKEMLVTRWQQESLRVFGQFLAKQFEALAWERRKRKPLWTTDARNGLEVKRRGVQQRIWRLPRLEKAASCRPTGWRCMWN